MNIARAVSNKLTDKVTTHLPEYLADQLRQLATQASCSEAELLRDMICLNLCGMTWGEHVANSRRQILRGQGALKAQFVPANAPAPDNSSDTE